MWYFLFCLMCYESMLTVAVLYWLGQHMQALFLFSRLMEVWS